jgi:hypothetical protein
LLTIESLLFAALGFLVAGLLTIVTAPLFWARAVRLTTRDIKSRMALTEREIEADRGRMRAEHAVLVHGLETRLANLRSQTDGARVEINRRDARIAELSRDLATEREALETSENARRVLERTIIDRVPDVERHLREARSELSASESEAQTLRDKVKKTLGALDEALEMNDQQRAEIGRLKSRIGLLEDDIKERDALAVGDARTSESAMRAELAALRARTRDQANLITRLQRAVGNGARSLAATDADGAEFSSGDGEDLARGLSLQAVEAKQKAAEGRLADRDRQIRVLEAEVAALREIATQNLEAAAAAARQAAAQDEDGAPPKTTTGKAAAAATPPAVSGEALKALEDAREAQVREQEQTIKRLRAELAAANDRLARELAKMKDELRRYSNNRGGKRGARGDDDTAVAPRSLRQAPLSQRVAHEVPDVLRTTNAVGRSVQPERAANGGDTTGGDPKPSPRVAPPVPLKPTPEVQRELAAQALNARIAQSAAAAAPAKSPAAEPAPVNPTPASVSQMREAAGGVRSQVEAPVGEAHGRANGTAKTGASIFTAPAGDQASGGQAATTPSSPASSAGEAPDKAEPPRRSLLARISDMDRDR